MKNNIKNEKKSVRLKANLRANLLKRKAQQRGRLNLDNDSPVAENTFDKQELDDLVNHQESE